MSIRPINFADGSIEVWHDEKDHGGTVALTDIAFGRKQDGSIDADRIEIACPVEGCNSVSVHPISGGASPGQVQKLFARLVMRRATILGIPVGQRSWSAIKERIKERVEAEGGPGRWRLGQMDDEDGQPIESEAEATLKKPAKRKSKNG